jgi:methionyl-tRNA formyltransferase
MLPAKSGIKGALTTLDGERIRVVRTRLDAHARSDGQPGEIVDRRGDDLLVQCGDGPLWVIQTEPLD